MRKALLIAGLTLAGLYCSAQSFWLETWSGTTCAALCTTYTGPNGAWATTQVGYNGTAANVWYFSETEKGQGRGVCGTPGAPATAHVGNVASSPAASIICPSGDCGALNDDWPNTTYTNVRLESPPINCTGKSGITLFFNYIEQGDTIEDYATLWYYNGSTWSLLSKPPQTNNASCSPQGTWTYYSIALPASANNNANVKVGFMWYNDTNAVATINQSYPSFAVDSIGLSATPTGINQLSNIQNVDIYPNPGNGRFTIKMPAADVKRVEVYNVLGEKVYSEQLSTNSPELIINIQGQPAGVYMCKLISGNGELAGQGKLLMQ